MSTSKTSEAVEAARMLDAQGTDFVTIVSLLEQSLGLKPETARGIAAQVCKPAPRRRTGDIFVRHPSVGRRSR